MALPLASLDDVNRVLGYTTGDDLARDAKLRSNLDAILSWAEGSLRIPAEGANVEVYYDVGDDATLHLPAPDVTVTKVKIVTNTGDDSFYWLYLNDSATGQGYDLDGEGRLILRPSYAFAPFEGAVASRFRRNYERVEVHYQGSGVVPKAVTEGIAFLTAGYHKYGPQALTNMKKEKIGDYSYELGGGFAGAGEEDLPYLTQAMFFLRRFMNTQRVQVI